MLGVDTLFSCGDCLITIFAITKGLRTAWWAVHRWSFLEVVSPPRPLGKTRTCIHWPTARSKTASMKQLCSLFTLLGWAVLAAHAEPTPTSGQASWYGESH